MFFKSNVVVTGMIIKLKYEIGTGHEHINFLCYSCTLIMNI